MSTKISSVSNAKPTKKKTASHVVLFLTEPSTQQNILFMVPCDVLLTAVVNTAGTNHLFIKCLVLNANFCVYL